MKTKATWTPADRRCSLHPDTALVEMPEGGFMCDQCHELEVDEAIKAPRAASLGVCTSRDAYLLTLTDPVDHEAYMSPAAYASGAGAKAAAQSMADDRISGSRRARSAKDLVSLKWEADEDGQSAEFGNAVFRVTLVQFYNS